MTANGTTLADAIWQPIDSNRLASLARELALILTGTLLIALTAQIRIPLWPVPVTGQTFGVLLIAAVLGRRSIFSVLAYLAFGFAGLPVFAAGAAGMGQLAGPTGGYLLGFVAAAYVVGWLAESGWDRTFGRAVPAMLIGNVIIYGFGLLWLTQFVPWPGTLQAGLVPFIPGDVLKILLAAGALPAIWKRVGA